MVYFLGVSGEFCRLAAVYIMEFFLITLESKAVWCVEGTKLSHSALISIPVAERKRKDF